MLSSCLIGQHARAHELSFYLKNGVSVVGNLSRERQLRELCRLTVISCAFHTSAVTLRASSSRPASPAVPVSASSPVAVSIRNACQPCSVWARRTHTPSPLPNWCEFPLPLSTHAPSPPERQLVRKHLRTMKHPVVAGNSFYSSSSSTTVNGHSSQLLSSPELYYPANMINNAVNRTGLHPGGVPYVLSLSVTAKDIDAD